MVQHLIITGQFEVPVRKHDLNYDRHKPDSWEHVTFTALVISFQMIYILAL